MTDSERIEELERINAQLAVMVERLRKDGAECDAALSYWVYGNGRKLAGDAIHSQCYEALKDWRETAKLTPPAALVEVLGPTMELLDFLKAEDLRYGTMLKVKIEHTRLQKLAGGGK